jgi:hypothetical protein
MTRWGHDKPGTEAWISFSRLHVLQIIMSVPLSLAAITGSFTMSLEFLSELGKQLVRSVAT